MDTPEILTQQSADIQIIVWLGGLMILGLLWTIRTLWNKYHEQAEYIRIQDKSNVLLLTELLNVAKVSGVDVSKVYDAIIERLLPATKDSGAKIDRLIENLNNK